MNETEGSGKIFPASIGSTPTFAETEAKPVQPIVSPAGQLIYPSQMPRRRGTTTMIVLILGTIVTGVITTIGQVYFQLFAHRIMTTTATRSAVTFWTHWALLFQIIGGIANFALSIAYFILLLVWTWRVHSDMGILTKGFHRPRPVLAMGLMFILIFHWFWLWHVLRKLAVRPTEIMPWNSPPAEPNRGPVGLVSVHIYLASVCLLIVGYCVTIAVSMFIAFNAADYFDYAHVWIQVASTLITAVLACALSICLIVALHRVGRAIADYTETNVRFARNMPLSAEASSGKSPISMPMTVPVSTPRTAKPEENREP